MNFSGRWSANLTKSKFLGPLARAVSVEIEHREPELSEVIVLTKHDSTEERVEFKCWTNGDQDKNLLNGRNVRGSARWEGKELIIESWMQFGEREMHLRDCWSLSADGQTLIMEHRNGDLAGQLTMLERIV